MQTITIAKRNLKKTTKKWNNSALNTVKKHTKKSSGEFIGPKGK